MDKNSTIVEEDEEEDFLPILKDKEVTMAKNLSRQKIAMYDRAAELLQRANTSPKSQQPRFDPKISPQQFFQQIYQWTKGSIFDEPNYVPDSRKRDAWLQKIVLKEPYLLGVFNSVVTIDKNRGFSIIGGKRQVNKFVSILHNFTSAPDVYGWRSGMASAASSYYGSDLGCVIEVARESEKGPMVGLFNVDSTMCSLTGKIESPLKYRSGKDEYEWDEFDYFRVASMNSNSEKFNGLGYCAVSRCLEYAKILTSIFEHDREKLGSKAPKGLLLLNGVTLNTWMESLADSSVQYSELERQYYTGVQVLSGDGISNNTSAQFIPLSTAPEGFDHKTFTDMMIYGYALAFGYDPREFWPVSGGQLGTSTETDAQHKKATGKGGMDFILGFQEKIQGELPETIDFEFEQRDVDGEIRDTQLRNQKFDMIANMFSASDDFGTLISRTEARQLMVEAKLIPEEWALEDDIHEVEDTEDSGEKLERARVQRAMEVFPEEDIVEYSYPINVFRTLKPASKGNFQITRSKLFAKGGVDILDEDVDSAIKEAERRAGKRMQLLGA